MTSRHTFYILVFIGVLSSACRMGSYDVLDVTFYPEAELEYQIEALLGEGALWDNESNEFIWVDIDGKTVNRYDPVKKTNTSYSLSGRPGTVVTSSNGKSLVVAMEGGIYEIDKASGEIRLISTIESLGTNRFNDGKCDPNGNLWVGSMNNPQDAATGKLYKVNENGDFEVMIDSVTISNGIVWTDDNSTMYYTDTPTSKIMAYDYDIKTSTISNERVAVNVNSKRDGKPDGMAIDSEGMLWVGMWDGSAVCRYNPRTGELIGKVPVPAHNVTSCAFGGKNLDELYITTSLYDMTEAEKKKYPMAGSVFKAIPGVKGVKNNSFGKAEIND